MPILKRKKFKKSFFRPVHLQAIIFLIIYNILSKTIFIKSVLSHELLINFFGPYLFGTISACIFLYLLSHEDFFHFIKEVEREEKSKEKKLLKKFVHHGKILTALLITLLSGPIFGALTIRLILPKYKYGYYLLIFGNIFSTILAVSVAKGLVIGLQR